MKEKTNLVCPRPDCGKKVSMMPTDSWGNNGTKFYYLICECGWESSAPWSECAIKHAEEAGDILEKGEQ